MKKAPPRCEVWELLEYAKKRLQPGMQVKCSLFGRVNAIRSNAHMGELIGEIPDWLQREARNNGLKVIGADFRDDKYTFEILPSNALAQADAACGVSPGAMGSAALGNNGEQT